MRTAKKKGIEVQRVKPLTSTRVIDALIGEKEETERKREKDKETECGAPAKLPWTIWSPPTTLRDHTVGLF